MSKNEIYKKYKVELDAVEKYIDNKYIYDIFYNYGFKINNKFIELDSNINVYEACFIALLFNIYINKYKTKGTLNVLEIGLAYGTSALIIVNEMIKYKYKRTYTVVDPNQTKVWESIGVINIKNFLKHMNQKLDCKLYEESSTTVFDKFKKKFDISFIDGSHKEEIVLQDLINSDNKLVKNGLIIVDDVLHLEVKKALITFLNKYKNYRKISIDINKFDFKFNEQNNFNKKSFFNPSTMHCYQKC
jgi:predicted O-methyltransferase YrrM